MDLNEYRRYVRTLAARRDGQPFYNASMDHALVVIESLFATANNRIDVLTESFNPRVYGREAVIEEAKLFLATSSEAAPQTDECGRWESKLDSIVNLVARQEFQKANWTPWALKSAPSMQMSLTSGETGREGKGGLLRMSGWDDFDAYSIGFSAPVASGVYMIRNAAGKVLYVGESSNVADRLLEHLKGKSDQLPCITRHGGSQFATEKVPGQRARQERERKQIDLYKPLCNR